MQDRNFSTVKPKIAVFSGQKWKLIAKTIFYIKECSCIRHCDLRVVWKKKKRKKKKKKEKKCFKIVVPLSGLTIKKK